MKTAILIYEGLTALDAIGPYEVLQSLPDNDVCFVAREKGPVRTDFGKLGLSADYAISDIDSADILLVPGTPHPKAVMGDEVVLEWIRHIDSTTQWTTSVCTGALGLGAAGLLQGKRATTHWLALETLRMFGAEPTGQRVVEDGKVITAAGVSAGIDMALTLASKLYDDETAQRIQLVIEYDPEPPFHAGSPDKASPQMVEALREEFGAQLSST